MECSQFSKIATFFKPNCSVMNSLRLSNFKDWNKRLNVANDTTSSAIQHGGIEGLLYLEQ